MTSDVILPLEERVLQLFEELGIERAHIAARSVGDWQGFATAHPDRIASLSLLCPMALDMRPHAGLASRTLVITGGRGATAERVATVLQSVGGIASVRLADYEALMWSDLAADRGSEIASAMHDFLQSVDRRPSPETLRLPETAGEAAGISYRIRGAGPPLVLMPLELAPSQWTPLLPALARHYSIIELGGAYLGTVALLEARSRSIIRTVLDLVQIR